MLQVSLQEDRIKIGQRFALSLMRTLRIPDDGKTYPLPPGLGRFPIHPVAEFADRLPAAWRERGGYFIPLYQREAMWLQFDAAFWKPNVVQVADAAGLADALGAAQAGDVIELADGTYGGTFSIDASGTAADPIVIRGASTAGTILDGMGAAGNVIEVYGGFIHIERMTIKNANRAIRFQTAGAEGNVVRAARLLGLKRDAMRYRIRRLQIETGDDADSSE